MGTVQPRRIQRLAPLALAAMVLVGCPMGHQSAATLEVSGLWWTPLQYGVKSFSGRVANRSDREYHGVTVTLELLDAQQQHLYYKTVQVAPIPPHGSREFSTWLLPRRPHAYRLVALTGHSGRQ